MVNSTTKNSDKMNNKKGGRRLSMEKADQIRKLHKNKKTKLTQEEIGDIFKVSREAINSILTGKTYKEI